MAWQTDMHVSWESGNYWNWILDRSGWSWPPFGETQIWKSPGRPASGWTLHARLTTGGSTMQEMQEWGLPVLVQECQGLYQKQEWGCSPGDSYVIEKPQAKGNFLFFCLRKLKTKAALTLTRRQFKCSRHL